MKTKVYNNKHSIDCAGEVRDPRGHIVKSPL